jgi:hypothetical protein
LVVFSKWRDADVGEAQGLQVALQIKRRQTLHKWFVVAHRVACMHEVGELIGARLHLG